MSLMTVYSHLENIFRQQILDSYPVDWKEDYITREILFEYRKLFRNIEINGLSSLPIKVNSIAYKLDGKSETEFGDIGFLIRITPRNGSCFEGVTSLEAKKIHKATRKFQEIKGKQLNRISSNLTYPMLLMYDFHPIKKFHDYSFFPSISKANHAAVVPIDIVELFVKDKDPEYSNKDPHHQTPLDGESIYQFSVPLAYQILFRYFRGLDLDFNPKLIRSIKGWEFEDLSNEQEISLPQYLLVISVSYGDSDLSMDFDINISMFSEIMSSEPEYF